MRNRRLRATLCSSALALLSCRVAPKAPPPEPAGECDAFVTPARVVDHSCEEVSADDPKRLSQCLKGSGSPGRWAVDDDGLPAYDFAIEQRCDPAGGHFSPRPTAQRDPIHLVGNGKGVVSMAHASGGVEVYSQERGHKWINFIDPGTDDNGVRFEPQLGGGFSYVVQGDEVFSTRFEDLPIDRALDLQSRRFGVGYYETVTQRGDFAITRKTFAPDADARALVSEVTIENRTAQEQVYGLIEFWDVNIHEIPVELLTSDLVVVGTTDAIAQRRRNLMQQFSHEVSWDAASKTAIVETNANTLPAGVTDRLSVSEVDYFPDPIFLSVLDEDAAVDGVWLLDDELWQGFDRRPPQALTEPGDASSRALTISGEGQPVVLAVRVPVTVPAGGRVTRRFSFGYAPRGSVVADAVGELAADLNDLAQDTASRWRDRLIWAAFPGLPDAGVIQRELAWASYNTLANVTFDEYHDAFLAGQGGSYKYIHGLDGAIGDYALFADALNLLDPKVARDTLRYSLSTQHASTDATPSRYPYATTGVGAFSDVIIYNQRSDAYYLLPTAVGRYVSLTRDLGFLDQVVPYWPRDAQDSGTVIDHLQRGLQFGTQTLGIGANGLVSMGTGDYADGVTNLTKEVSTPGGTSSTYNAGFVIWGFNTAAELIEGRDPTFANELRSLAQSQAEALNQHAFDGRWYLRGFVDSGAPLAPDIFFLEPQVFPILAGIVDEERRDLLFSSIALYLETTIGAMSNTAYESEPGTPGGVDQPQVSGIWPIANAWLTEAYSMRDPVEGWDSFIRNTLSAHAVEYPEIWYGIWTGPDSFNGPAHERAGEADAHIATALTDYPALNAHMHTSTIRALQGIMGVSGTKTGLKITPRVPTENFQVVWPRLSLRYQTDAISGSYTASTTGPTTIEIALPSGLQGVTPQVKVAGQSVTATVNGTLLQFTLPAVAESAVSFSITE